jgi:hypothetical protein
LLPLTDSLRFFIGILLLLHPPSSSDANGAVAAQAIRALLFVGLGKALRVQAIERRQNAVLAVVFGAAALAGFLRLV